MKHYQHGGENLPVCDVQELLNGFTDDGEIVRDDEFRLMNEVFFMGKDDYDMWDVFLRNKHIGVFSKNIFGKYSFRKLYADYDKVKVFDFDFYDSVESLWKHLAQIFR